ncbi:NADH-quinone oxidoreductase subunit G [Friedmanniella endophytica]|uniref:NADH-quinone oxidoreductase n=1 Tax=Microlunatus kandeliicorticis TaxID=1759536 RepID=A0A7W3IPG1_9ACTN|nr:NADH-quinone oxidoreductase subunit G [Microlunatus kandeliicorticis]MBA8792785.1 NADH-quinone oxidoreductase subunit G [Microlunatus kandeliicorticis]
MTVTDGTRAGELEKREDLVTLTIDDVEVSVPKGTLVIRAAELIGVEIPRFCDHPLLDPVGACRQCLVEVPDMGNGRGMPKPQASCTLEVMPGMQIRTQFSSSVADKAQRGQMEFLLINHPLDCPICDKGGECPLQNQAMTRGSGESRFDGVKRTYPKPIRISSQVLLDRERCVLCARCTRFSEQVAGDPFIALVERGALQQVGIYERQPFESYFSGNTIQICPVGALTSSAYRFRSRPFDLVSTPSVGEHDACGSAIRVDHRRGTVMRRLSGDDPEVNEEWITDKDRFAFRYGRGADRLTTPLVRVTDESGASVLRPASWPEAIDAAVEGLRRAGTSVGVLTGGRLTLEDAYAYSKFARTVIGTNDIDFRARPHSSEEAAFLAAVVAGSGVSAEQPGGLRSASFADLEHASSVLMVCFEPEEEAGTVFLRLRKGFRKRGLRSWTIAPFLSPGARKAGAQLIATVPGGEAAAVSDLPDDVFDSLDADSVIIVGERAALQAGTLTAVLRVAEHTGARLAWIPRRAGDRGALDAGCLPTLLPGGRPVADATARVDAASVWGVESLPRGEGRDADEMLTATDDRSLDALVVAGIEPSDFADPAAVRAGLENAGFLISLETRTSEVTERADVVFPVSLVEEREGSFVNWEGRPRPFPTVISKPNALSDLRVLAALADGLGRDLGFRTAGQARSEFAEFAGWDGARVEQPAIDPPSRPEGDHPHLPHLPHWLHRLTTARPGGSPAPGTPLVLAGWRMALDDSRAVRAELDLLDTARRPVARVSPATAERAGLAGRVVVSSDRGSLAFPLEVTEGMVDGVVWVPVNAPGLSVPENLAAGAGDVVHVQAGQ